jgi:Na+-transporting methylmalonyl-CoA/oxaloacetate decarboxylase gamma subunit
VQTGEDENHWPGYVDALTTMTMMLVFVMMVLAVAIYGLSENVSRVLVEKIAKSAGIQVETEGVTTEEIAQRVAVALERRTEGRYEAQAKVAPDRPAKVVGTEVLAPPLEGEEKVIDAGKGVALAIPRSLVLTDRTPSLITLKFQPRATAVDDLAAAEMKEFVTTRGLGENGASFEIRGLARLDTGAATDARRVAYYRAMAVRSRLIAMGVRPERISLQVIDRQSADDTDKVEIGARERPTSGG